MISAFLSFSFFPTVSAQDVLLIPEKELSFYITQGEVQNRSVQVLALANDTEIEVLPSKLSSKSTTGFIDSDEILVNNTLKFKTIMDEGDIRNLVNSVKADKPGIYKGSLMIHNNKNDSVLDIPVNLEGSPSWPYYVGILWLDLEFRGCLGLGIKGIQ